MELGIQDQKLPDNDDGLSDSVLMGLRLQEQIDTGRTDVAGDSITSGTVM
jgi:hypothetical protein